MLARRGQFHQSRLVDVLTPFNQLFVDARKQMTQQAFTGGYDLVTSGQIALGQIYESVQRQAMGLSYFDLFWLFAMAAFCLPWLVFLMRRSVPEKGTEVSAH